jgi:hypothetical protein
LITSEKIVDAARALALPAKATGSETDIDAPTMELMPEHVIVDISPVHFGMKKENPLDHVRFYSKLNPDGAPVNVNCSISVPPELSCSLSQCGRWGGVYSNAQGVCRSAIADLCD